MSVRLEDGMIRLEGRCRIEEAETLLALLVEDDRRVVDLSRCGPMHSAVAQILLAVRPVLSGTPYDPFLCAHILPLLEVSPPSSGSAHP